jgi:thymidylate synthase (FAD)
MGSVRLISYTVPVIPEFQMMGEESAEALMAYCARVSSDNQDNPDYEKLLRYCLAHGHYSVFEMAHCTFEITTSRAIAQQILRHRSFSFQEFCISGDTEISCIDPSGKVKRRSIVKLFQLQNDSRWSRLVRVYDQKTKTLVAAKVKEVFYTGKKPVYEMVLSNGKKIRSTKEHKFLTKVDFKELGDIGIGDAIACNGLPVYQDYAWMKAAKEESIENGTGVQGIADKAGMSYHTIRKWLKVLKLGFTKKEVSSYVESWNKGLPAEQQPRYQVLSSEETRTKQRASSRKGEDSNLYKNGNSKAESYRRKVWQWQNKYKFALMQKYQGKCSYCQSEECLQIDHIIAISQEPSKARDVNNLHLLCRSCHKKKTLAEMQITLKWAEVVSIEYVGEEETYDMEIDHEDHNYVANGIITHNSQRYQKASLGYQLYPARSQDHKNRQNSIDNMPESTQKWFEWAQRDVQELSELRYLEALDLGIAKEQARFLLPLSTTTKMYMTGSVRSWIHYFKVRLDKSTQKEHRDIAAELFGAFSRVYPTIAKLIKVDA